MTTTNRTIPTKRFGNIPELDQHITKNRGAVRQKRYSVDNVFFANITLAREFVIETKKIKVRNKILSNVVECSVGSGWHKSTAKKATAGYKTAAAAKMAVAAQAAAQEERVTASRKKNGTAKLSKTRKQITKTGTVRITREVIEGTPNDVVRAAHKLGW